MSFWGTSKESDVERLLKEHVKLINQTVCLVEPLFKAYFDRDLEYRSICKKIHTLEHEADVVRRQVEKKLHEGAFLAIFREDFIALAEAIDRIANKAESVADALTLEHPAFPDRWHCQFLKLARLGATAFEPFTKIGNPLDRELDDIMSIMASIEKIEQQADDVEWHLLESIFNTDIKLALKIQLRDFVKRLGAISDLCEDASDILSTLVVKRRV